jgi:hypothetical protein
VSSKRACATGACACGTFCFERGCCLRFLCSLFCGWRGRLSVLAKMRRTRKECPRCDRSSAPTDQHCTLVTPSQLHTRLHAQWVVYQLSLSKSSAHHVRLVCGNVVPQVLRVPSVCVLRSWQHKRPSAPNSTHARMHACACKQATLAKALTTACTDRSAGTGAGDAVASLQHTWHPLSREHQ